MNFWYQWDTLNKPSYPQKLFNRFFMFTGSSRTFPTDTRLLTFGERYSGGWLGLFGQHLAFSTKTPTYVKINK